MKSKNELIADAIKLFKSESDFKAGVMKAHNYLYENSEEYRIICAKPIEEIKRENALKSKEIGIFLKELANK